MKNTLLYSPAKEVLKNLILLPLLSGLYGFTIFFTTIVLAKGFSALIGITDYFIVDIDDIYFSLIGFILLFLIKLLKNISPSSLSHE